MKRGITFFFLLCVLVFQVTLPISAEPVSLPDNGGFLDLPEGWEVLAVEPEKVTFTSPGELAYFQLKWYPRDRFDGIPAFFEEIKEELNATGEGEAFAYQGCDAALADLQFSAGEYLFRGYLLFLEHAEFDLVLLSFASKEAWEMMHDHLLSSLDSYAHRESDLKFPGPISQYLYPFPGPDRYPVSIQTPGGNGLIWYDPGEIDALEVLIEREARILSGYPEGSNEAWRRFYRIIYRDSYQRFSEVHEILETELLADDPDDRELARRLLFWIQGFDYTRTGTLADIQSPLETVIFATGDCDSRGILYSILLEYFGIPSVLMVSSVYEHSLVGVGVSGEGARFSFGGKEWLVAETTDDVEIGLIDRTMADPANWIGVSFY